MAADPDDSLRSLPARPVPPPDDRLLELAQGHLAAIVETSEDAIASKTLDGIVTSWNRAAERLFGYCAAEMIGQPITKIIPPELQHEETGILARLRAGECISRYETVRLRKDGTRVEVSLTLSPIRDRSGRVVGAGKIAHDITSRKMAERAIAEEAHALETLNRVGQAVAAQFDLERIVQIVTDAATELSGAAFGAFFYNVVTDGEESYWLHSLSGASRESFAHFSMPRSTAVFAPTFLGERIVRSDDIQKHPDYGRNLPYRGLPPGHLPVRSYLAVPVVSHSGQVLGGLFLGHPDPGRFNELAERRVAGIATQAGIAIDKARLFQTLRDRESQLIQSAADRNQILESERGARAEAERLSHMKDEFLATLSHELRTPLNAIQGWTALLRQANVSAEDQARGLQTIERNVRAQAQIVNDLLDMSRVISGKIHLEVQPLLLHEVIRNALDAVRQSAAAKGIRIRQRFDTGIGPVRADPNRLQQVLWNLLSNAVKFTPEGGQIVITLRRIGTHIEIEVEDSGVGIRPDFLPHVFDRFRQADATTTRRYGGLGLGLSIVRSLVELHGGSVRVNSPGENEGTIFTVELPLAQAAGEESPQARRMPAPEEPLNSIELPRLDDVSVLVVDDTPDGRGLLSRILEGRGATTTCASSASEALACLGSGRFDVLLSDIGMPDMDGYELMRRVRAAEPPGSSPIPAIAVTAYARSEDRQRSLLAGYQMHLSKPIEARELVAGISTLLHLSR
ncbi:MAG TPA: ATP-binding protein [Steroidobacteraceae bacterium]|nr:ATP-binding protein [Steroidobacteraceae bacterium]